MEILKDFPKCILFHSCTCNVELIGQPMIKTNGKMVKSELAEYRYISAPKNSNKVGSVVPLSLNQINSLISFELITIKNG